MPSRRRGRRQRDAADVPRAGDEPAAACASTAAARSAVDLLLGVPQPAEDAGDPLGQLLGPHLEHLGELADEHVLAGEEAVRVDADQRLDPAHAGADRRLAEQLDQAELAGARGVRAAAQLAGVVADLDDAHLRRRTSRRTAPSRRSRAPRPGVMMHGVHRRGRRAAPR